MCFAFDDGPHSHRSRVFAGIFLNIQNFLVFQLSTAVAALSLITLSTVLGLPNPLNPMQVRPFGFQTSFPAHQFLQILFINILVRQKSAASLLLNSDVLCSQMDGPPSQSLGVDPVNHDMMRRPPRPKNAPILSQRLLARVGFSASIIIVGVLFVLAAELGDGSMAQRDQTMVRLP